MKRIKKGDEVIIITGKSKGHVGKVLKVLDQSVLVEGGNIITKHMKPNTKRQNENGGIVKREAAIHISNIAHYNPVTKKADRIGFKFLQNDNESTKVRYYKSNNEIVDRI